jgi:xanthine/uracil permease
MKLKYELDQRPPFVETLLFGFQWFAIAIPVIIIIGKIGGGLYFEAMEDQITYLQKMSFLMAVALFVQIMWGHRMPLIIGPSTILLVGIIASRGHDANTIYTAIIAGGAFLSFISITGLFIYLKRLFTSRVVAVVLLLIAFSLLPTIIRLITFTEAGITPFLNIVFSLILIILTFTFHRYLFGLWKSTLIVWVMILGSIFYFMIFPGSFHWENSIRFAPVSGFLKHLTTTLTFNPGVLISFLICFVALSINDVASIQSINELLKPANTSKRITYGVFITGLANIAAGFLGVIGPVNYSLSPGVLAYTKCASRFTMIPTALLLLILSFSPFLIGFIGTVPPVVIGSVLIYLLCAQITTGLMVAIESEKTFKFDNGLIIGLPVLLATMIDFLPSHVLDTFPAMVKPILGNGFIVGILSALLLEHVLFKE